MEINKDLISKLTSLDDAALSEIVRAVAQAAGAGKRQTERAVKNTSFFKERAKNMTDEDIKKLMSELGEDKAREILSKLNF